MSLINGTPALLDLSCKWHSSCHCSCVVNRTVPLARRPSLSCYLTGVVSNVLLSGAPAPFCLCVPRPLYFKPAGTYAKLVTWSGVSVPQRMSPNRDIEWFAAMSDFTQTGISKVCCDVRFLPNVPSRFVAFLLKSIVQGIGVTRTIFA